MFLATRIISLTRLPNVIENKVYIIEFKLLGLSLGLKFFKLLGYDTLRTPTSSPPTKLQPLWSAFIFTSYKSH